MPSGTRALPLALRTQTAPQLLLVALKVIQVGPLFVHSDKVCVYGWEEGGVQLPLLWAQPDPSGLCK